MKKSYQVRRRVDDSVHYFEVGHFLGGGGAKVDDDDKTKIVGRSNKPSIDRVGSRQQRKSQRRRGAILRSLSKRTQVRSSRLRDSVLNSQDLENVTNIDTFVYRPYLPFAYLNAVREAEKHNCLN